MPSLHKFMLDAFVRALDDGPCPLYLADVHVNYNWGFLPNGTAIAKRRDLPAEVEVQSVEFLTFGIICSLREDGAILLSDPCWHNQGSAGNLLTVRYGQQMLALVKALESHGLDGYFDHEGIIVNTHSRAVLPIGTTVFATTTLTIFPALGDREEHYTLDAVRVEAVRAVA